MRVKAIAKGFDGMQLKYPGDVFEIASEKQFSAKWMEHVDPKPVGKPVGKVAPPKPAAKATGDHEVI